MNEYSWRVQKAWIGIENDTGVEPVGDLPEITRKMTIIGKPAGCIGVIIRSGRVQACGQFCFVNVSVNGKKVIASGAEDRIYPFHSVKLSEIGAVPKDMIPALGFSKDGNTYCFLYKGRVVAIDGPGKDGPDKSLVDVPQEHWQPGWGKALGGWSPAVQPRMPDSFFRQLSVVEVEDFKAWSRTNYKVGEPIEPVWHPVCRAECEKMNAEAEGNAKDA